MAKILNFNVGVLGHIDSGKTSLAKALSTVASTASFDKHPQSQERGITLDLGFSSFSVPAPAQLVSDYGVVQFTLVDCPGHASLIKTIIGGAQIIDLMMLVIDSTKGIQTQTAECLVIGEITCEHMLVVLNKVDLLDSTNRDELIAKLTRKLAKTLDSTRFAGARIVPVAAKPGGAESTATASGVDKLIEVLCGALFVPKRSTEGPFVFSVDHCFPIRGQGTVMTGTVLSGCIGVNDTIEIPSLKVTKKVKSLQMFHKPVQAAAQGDRLGVCVTHFDPKQVERCLISSPGCLATQYGQYSLVPVFLIPPAALAPRQYSVAKIAAAIRTTGDEAMVSIYLRENSCVIKVFKIPYHKSTCSTGAKFHVTIGHETVMAKATFFTSSAESAPDCPFDLTLDYHYENCLLDSGPIHTHYSPTSQSPNQFALIEFERPVTCPAQAHLIGSRLDADAFANTCRIAFHGKLSNSIVEKDYEKTFLHKLKVFKDKCREGIVERVQDDRTVIGKSLFKKETKLDAFIGLKVQLSTGETGIIEGAFGSSGKFRVAIPDGLNQTTIMILDANKKRSKSKVPGAGSEAEGVSELEGRIVKITLNFKRYIFDPLKRMSQ